MPIQSLLAFAPLDTWQATVPAAIALFLPLTAFAIILTFTVETRRGTAGVAVVFAAASFLTALFMLAIALKHPQHLERNLTFLQFFTGQSAEPLQFKLEWGVVADPLAATLLCIVTGISLLVQVYSVSYMRGDEGYVRFYILLTFFTFAMSGLVLSTNYFELFLFWELVGVCSYLLIGHWWRRSQAAAAATKAFLITRLGDAGLLVAILYIFFRFNDLNFERLASQYTGGKVSAFGLTVMALLVFAAVVGKSAQLPLHVWLLDAMEAPIPVSALIHSATMVAAGVYLVARTYALFHASPQALLVVAFVGAGTAVLAAVWALAEDDLKRVIAYSTMSQVGLMLCALGIGAFSLGVFHLFTHAWYKALLFLGAGAVIQSLRSHNIWEMGGLWRRMPFSAWIMLIGTAAAAGLPPFSGFWSKDAIVSETLRSGNRILAILVLATSFLSALFLFRMFFVVFTGETARRRRFDVDKIRDPGQGMATPLAALAIVSLGAGVAWLPWLPKTFGTFVTFPDGGRAQPLDPNAAFLSSGLALAGLLVAWVLYARRLSLPAAAAGQLSALRTALERGFYIDAAYRHGLARALLLCGRALDWVDRRLVDGFVEGLGQGTLALGRAARRLETGRAQQYALGVFAGVLAMAAVTAALGLQAVRRLLGGS